MSSRCAGLHGAVCALADAALVSKCKARGRRGVRSRPDAPRGDSSRAGTRTSRSPVFEAHGGRAGYWT